MVEHTDILALRRWRQEDCKFEASLGYIAKLPASKKKKGLLAC
jgi:hypothetical protein